MPLIKKQSGWFWGSKGPFSTKAKALAVARAAYAAGYKGESVMLKKDGFLNMSETSCTNSTKKCT